MTNSGLVKKPLLSEVIKTDASINMDSIVSVFITKYEKSLYEGKEFISKEISKIKTEVETSFKKELETFVNLKKYNTTIHPFEIEVISELTFSLTELVKTNKIYIECNSKNRMQGHLAKTLEVKVSPELVAKAQNYLNSLTSNTQKLNKILQDISSISRKEREVRGKIAEKTLRESGFDGLFEDPSLLALVELPTLSDTSTSAKKKK